MFMLRSFLAGQDGPNQRALPAGEFLHPVPLAALLLLVANDWWWKPGSVVPAALTGKLSDFAGLLFFPLLLTALVDCVLLAGFRLGLSCDFSLRRAKLALAIVGTGLCFAALKVNPEANQAAHDIAKTLGMTVHIVRDLSDLAALPVLWLSWRLGLAEIARVPLGRIELIEGRYQRSQLPASQSLGDIVGAGADPSQVSELVDALDEYLAAPTRAAARRVDASLAALRDLSPKSS